MAKPNGAARKIDRVAVARSAFEAAGIEFIDGDPPTVKLRSIPVDD